MITLTQYSHLIALAQECHFARAASKVFVTQSALSRSIQAVEKTVGMLLFERTTGVVRPTPAGIFLLERAHKLLFEARCVQRDVDLYRENQLGDTAFGVGPIPAAAFLHQIVPVLREQYPQIGVRVELHNWRQLLAILEREDIEFFIAETRDIPKRAGLKIVPFTREPGGFYVRAGHPLDGSVHRMESVWQYGVGATKLPEVIREMLAKILGLPAGVYPKLGIECDDLNLLHTTAQATDLVIVSVDKVVHHLIEDGVLRKLTILELPVAFAEIGLVSLRNRTLSPMAHCVIDLFRSLVAEQGLPPP